MFHRIKLTGVPLCIQKVKAGNCLYTIPMVYHCRMMYSCIAHSFYNCSNNEKFVKLCENGNSAVISGHYLRTLMAIFHFLKYSCVTIVNVFSVLYMWDWGMFLEKTWYTQKNTDTWNSFHVIYIKRINCCLFRVCTFLGMYLWI